MDLATILGIIIGILLIIWSITMNSGLEIFVNYPGLMIVLGGTFSAVLIAYPMNEVLKVIKILRKVFMFKISEPRTLINELVDVATKAKRNGILAIDRELNNINNDFMRKGLQLVVDGVMDSSIDNILNIEVVNIQRRHSMGWQIFSEMGKYAPAFGMVGTLIGLIQMLANLEDPGSIGPKMAVALITTFYGAFLSNLVFIPMSVKLKRRSQQESLLMNLIIEAIKSIRIGENPKLMEDKLTKFLSDGQKSKGSKTSSKTKTEVKEVAPG